MTTWKESRRSYRLFRAEGKLVAARECLETAIKQLADQELRELPSLYNQLARLNLELKDPVAAERAARQAIDAEMKLGPPALESDHSAAYHVMLAYTLKEQGKYTEASAALLRGIELYRLHLDSNNELIVDLTERLESWDADKWREHR